MQACCLNARRLLWTAYCVSVFFHYLIFLLCLKRKVIYGSLRCLLFRISLSCSSFFGMTWKNYITLFCDSICKILSAEDTQVSYVVWKDHNPRRWLLVQVWHTESPFYILCRVLVSCITITDSTSFGNCLPVRRCPHITTGWSLSFISWQYRANTSPLVRTPSCTDSLCQGAFRGHQNDLWWCWEKRDFKTISCITKNKGTKGPFSFTWICACWCQWKLE